MNILRPITQWARNVRHTERIPESMAVAFRHTTSGRPLPVFLELAIDVLFARADEERVEFPRFSAQGPGQPGKAALAQALGWLREAKRPAILAGGGVWFAQAAAELTRFCGVDQHASDDQR
jgi:acetolactate synthase-1/2/3 large subunit